MMTSSAAEGSDKYVFVLPLKPQKPIEMEVRFLRFLFGGCMWQERTV